MDFHATAGKLYYVEVHNGPSDPTVPYTLEPNFTPVPDTFERNDSFNTAKAAPVGQAFDLFLFAGEETNAGDDKDFFTIDAPAGKTKLRVQIENKSPADAKQTHGVRLYGSNKAQSAPRIRRTPRPISTRRSTSKARGRTTSSSSTA